MFGRLLDVGEGQGPIVVGDIFDLIEPRNGVTNMLRVGHRLFALARKCKDRVGPAAFGRQLPVLLMRLPGRLHRDLLLGSLASGAAPPTERLPRKRKTSPFV